MVDSAAQLEPGFTVLIPTYNSGDRLDRCLTSVRAQEFPQDLVQIVVADGGSGDHTVEVALRYGAEVVDNPERLAEQGLRVGMSHVKRELVVIFADDNELVQGNWMATARRIFDDNPTVCAFWCRLLSGPDDPPVNHYFAYLQSEPMSFFINKYLDDYMRTAPRNSAGGIPYKVFDVDQHMPLVWGANGLTYRTQLVKPLWERESYLGDNDAFQIMLEQGHRTVAYSVGINVYHHHVNSLWQWRSKWKRNFEKHFLSMRESRNLSWLYVPRFKLKLVLWSAYSLVPVFTLMEAVYRMVMDRDWHWIYHPAAAFLQSVTYLQLLLFSREGRRYLKDLLGGREAKGVNQDS